MPTFIALNTIKHKGKQYLPGTEIEVGGEVMESLLKHGAIRAQEAEDEGEKALSEYKIDELKTLAVNEGVDLQGLTLKADIVGALENALTLEAEEEEKEDEE